MIQNKNISILLMCNLCMCILLCIAPALGAFDDYITYNWTETNSTIATTNTSIFLDGASPYLMSDRGDGKLWGFYGGSSTSYDPVDEEVINYVVLNTTDPTAWQVKSGVSSMGDINGYEINTRSDMGHPGFGMVFYNGEYYTIQNSFASGGNIIRKSTDGVGYNWEVLNGGAQPDFPLRHAKFGFLNFNGKMWVIAGHIFTDHYIELGDVWSSYDGITWENQTSVTFPTAPVPYYPHYVGSYVLNEKMHAIWYSWKPIEGVYHQYITDYATTDGVIWDDTIIGEYVTNMTSPYDFKYYEGIQPMYYYSDDNKIYTFNGKVYLSYTSMLSHLLDTSPSTYVVYSSPDGITWTLEYEDLFSNPFTLLGNVVEYNGKLYSAQPTAQKYNSWFYNLTGSNIAYSTDGVHWDWLYKRTGNAMNARTQQTSVYFNNQTYIIGGFDGSDYHNDIWVTTTPDDIDSWLLLNGQAAFSERAGQTSVVFDNKMWVIGGHNSTTYLNDVWYSNDGYNWSQATSNAGFSARSGHTSVVYEGDDSPSEEMWVIGGYDGTFYKRDVWHSANGVTWTQSTNSAAFEKRANQTSTIFKDHMWVIGGENEDKYFNDVWESHDGVIWAEVTSDASFTARSGHSTQTFTNKMWVINGYNSGWPYNNGNFNDVWYSTDGDVWVQQQVSDDSWYMTHARAGAASSVTPTDLYLFGGRTDEAVNANMGYSVPNIIYGWVYDNFGYMINGATVNIWNTTWSSATTSDSEGFYYFDGLAPATIYTMNASKSGYKTHINIPVNSSVEGTLKEQDFELYGLYSLTVNLIDRISKQTIVANNASAYLYMNSTNDYVGYGDTTNGSIKFSMLTYGQYTVTGIADGYNPNSTTLTLTNTTDLDLYLTPYGGGNTSLWATAQTVSFTCVDQKGDPIKDMNVTMVGVESTLGVLDWAASLFGINLETTPITSTTMTGTTGNNGAIVFVMVPTEKYAVTYKSAEKGINETRYYYPSESEYLEVFWIDIPTYSSDVVTYQLWNQTNITDNAYMDLGAYYSDTAANTDNIVFWVKNKQKEQIYSSNYTTTSSLNISYPVEIEEGEIYYWGLSANNTKYKNQFNVSHYIKFKESPLVIDLRIGYDTQAMEYYNWISIIAIILPCASLAYSRRTIKYACAMLGIMAITVKGIGWFSADWLIVGVVATLGFLLYFRFAEQEM